MLWVDAQHDVVHRRVSNEHNFYDVSRLQLDLRAYARSYGVQSFYDRLMHLVKAVIMHHCVGYASHYVLAIGDLWVHHRFGGDHFSRTQIA